MEEANDARSSGRRLHAIYLFSRKNFSSKFGDSISLVRMSELAIELYWAIQNIALKMSLSPGYKCGDSFNFHLQKSIARWESRLRSVQMWHDVKYEALDFLL